MGKGLLDPNDGTFDAAEELHLHLPQS